jgi:hypothetical protein
MGEALDDETDQCNKTVTFKEREITRVFEAIEGEIALMTASAQFNYTTCQSDEKTLMLTLAYIEDTKKLISVLKQRMSLLQKTI